MKTKQELDALKADWLYDPCWDIEDTEGFEGHREELKAWRIEREQKWQAQELERVTKKADELKCSVELVGYLELLEYRIRQIDNRA